MIEKKADTPSCPARACASFSVGEVMKRLQSEATGLAEKEAARRRTLMGENSLPRAKRPGLPRRVLEQFMSPLILILVGVAIVVPLLGHVNDAFVILFVLAFNTVIGVIQEGRASRALEALDRAFTHTCTVERGGRVRVISSADVAVGDIVLLQEGDRIPADGRFIEDVGLRVDESMLTGESAPVTKTSGALTLPPRAALGDIRNAGFAQTLVVAGRGILVVCAVGRETEVGHIAEALGTRDTEPPLAKKVRRLSGLIAIVVAIFAAMLFVIGIALGQPALTLLATVMSLAVSIIPEGLPIVLTLVLARGVAHMAERNAVVKKLNAVEGLGQVQVICTDKTGTLTTNELVVQRSWSMDDSDALAFGAGLFGNHALREEMDGRVQVVGDPIDGAMRAFSLREGAETKGWTLLQEKPFSYTEKRRSGRWTTDGRAVAFLAGSPETVLAICGGNTNHKRVESMVSKLAAEGLRVIALATRDGDLDLDDEAPWTFTGLLGMGDTLRPKVVESVAWCRQQGIRVVMVTGDHPETALAIAKIVGIADDPKDVLNGPDMERMSDAELEDIVGSIRVFSRIAPTDKLRIVDAFRSKQLLTAMTGDGVNDAPALQRADIGVAMGKSGTDVAREAADLVLLDDNFATIVTAIQEGRSIVNNVRRVIMYLFSTNLAETALITITLLFRLPLPLLPGQIIWINLVTDSFLDVSLGLEPKHGGTAKGGTLLDRRSVVRVLLLGSVMTAGTFLVYATSLHRSTASLQTLTLTTLAAFQWFNAWNARSETRSLLHLPFASNKLLIVATCVVVTLQILAVYAPPFQRLLGTTSLPLSDWGIVLGIGFSILIVDEIWKRLPHKATVKTPVLS